MKKESFNLGMSIAFSHGTANALIMGTFLMQSRGLADFICWAIPNTLCMPIFGWLYHKGWLRKEIISSPLVKFGMIALQCSMLILELKLLQTFMQGFTDDFLWSTVLASMIAGTFILWMLKDGLNFSIFTHLWQGSITLVSFILVIAYCLWNHVPTIDLPKFTSIPWEWMFWTSAVYISSMIADLQHWQRADIDFTRTAFRWAALIFGSLMLLIGGIAQFNLPTEMRLFLILPLLMLSTSTIDSLAVAMHICINKYVGTSILIVICAGWWLFLDDQAIEVWNYHGVVRCVDTLLICALSSYWWMLHRKKSNIIDT